MAVVPRAGVFVSTFAAFFSSRHGSPPLFRTYFIRHNMSPPPSQLLMSLRSTNDSDRRRMTRSYCLVTKLTDATTSNPHPMPGLLDPVMEAAEALDIRVGRVIKAWRHPEADSLYVEEIDVGEGETRTICSGLVGHVPLEQLQDSEVIVLTNLKPRNMRGIKSCGMLMAASNLSHSTVELLIPPKGSIPGERIWFGPEEENGKQPDAATPNQVQKKKLWETVQPHLRTTDMCHAALGDKPMRTSAGIVTSKSLRNANIS